MLKSKNAWRQRGNLLLYLPSRPVKPQPCSPDWQEAPFVISKMYAWPCNAVIFDVTINEMSPTLPWSVAWISPVLPSSSHSSTFENMTWSPPFILSFRRCVCFITSTFGANMKNMKCLWNTSAFCANMSTPPGRGHSGWSLRGPQRHHCQCTCGRFLFLSALSHNSISISIWIDIAFYIQSKFHLRPHYFHFFTRL